MAPLCAALTILLTVLPTAAASGQPRARAAAVSVSDVQVSHDQYLAHSEPAIAENPRNASNLIAGSKMFTDPTHYAFKIGTYYTKDGGKTWHDSGFLPGFGDYTLVSDVSIAYAPDGTAYACVLAWDGANQSGIFVSRSTDGGQTFSQPVTVFLDTSGATFNDKPWIAVDTTKGPNRGTIYVAWNMDSAEAAAKDPDGGFASPHVAQQNVTSGMVVSRSTDGGKTYSDPVVVAPFDQDHFYIGAIPAVAPNGTLSVVFTSMDGAGTINGLAMVQSKDGGKTFSPARIIQSDVWAVPDHLRHSTFRNITMPSFAISPKDGSMVVVWGDYRYDDADVFASTSRDGGATWSKPVRVNHDTVGNGKDQFEPEVAVSPKGTFTCAWFDRRYDPGDRLIDESVAQSTNDGRAWGRSIRVTKKSWDPAIDAPQPEGKASNTFIGDYQALAVDNTTVHPLWNDTQNGKSQEIRSARVSVQLFRRG